MSNNYEQRINKQVTLISITLWLRIRRFQVWILTRSLRSEKGSKQLEPFSISPSWLINLLEVNFFQLFRHLSIKLFSLFWYIDISFCLSDYTAISCCNRKVYSNLITTVFGGLTMPVCWIDEVPLYLDDAYGYPNPRPCFLFDSCRYLSCSVVVHQKKGQVNKV
jgi:hypothetical protein